MALYNQLFFQYAASDNMVNIISLHNQITFYLILVLTLVLVSYTTIVHNGTKPWTKPDYKFIRFISEHFLSVNRIAHGALIEVFWTVAPTIILILIAIPSFKLLYEHDSIHDNLYTIKVTGHQWYWSYEVPNQPEYDSYMLPFSDLKLGDMRLLEVDNALHLPANVRIRFLVTSADVLHSFAVPALGIKIDAVPGRLNQITCIPFKPGRFFGQCSEICGVNHGFMPIVVNIEELYLAKKV